MNLCPSPLPVGVIQQTPERPSVVASSSVSPRSCAVASSVRSKIALFYGRERLSRCFKPIISASELAGHVSLSRPCLTSSLTGCGQRTWLLIAQLHETWRTRLESSTAAERAKKYTMQMITADNGDSNPVSYRIVSPLWAQAAASVAISFNLAYRVGQKLRPQTHGHNSVKS